MSNTPETYIETWTTDDGVKHWQVMRDSRYIPIECNDRDAAIEIYKQQMGNTIPQACIPVLGDNNYWKPLSAYTAEISAQDTHVLIVRTLSSLYRDIKEMYEVYLKIGKFYTQTAGAKFASHFSGRTVETKAELYKSIQDHEIMVDELRRISIVCYNYVQYSNMLNLPE